MDPAAIEAARKKLAARMGGGASAQIGGKGTVRRKPAKGPKASGVDDKRLQAVLKRLNVTAATGVEEVSIFKSDGSFTYFSSPKLQANLSSNTFVVSGSAEERKASASSMSMEQQFKQQFPGALPPGMKPEDLLKHLQKTGGLGAGAGDEDMPDLEGVSFDAPAAEDDDEMPSLETK